MDGSDAGLIGLQQGAVGIFDKQTGRERHAGIAGRFLYERYLFAVVEYVLEIFKKIRIVFLDKRRFGSRFVWVKTG